MKNKLIRVERAIIDIVLILDKSVYIPLIGWYISI